MTFFKLSLGLCKYWARLKKLRGHNLIHRQKVKRHRVKRQRVKRQRVERQRVKSATKGQKVKMIKIFFNLNHRKLATLINFVHGSYMLDMDIIDHVAAALGPLACPSRSARPRKCLNLT